MSGRAGITLMVRVRGYWLVVSGDTVLNGRSPLWDRETSVCVCVFPAYRSVLTTPTKTVRDTLVNQCAQILSCYRKNCASPSSAGQVSTSNISQLLAHTYSHMHTYTHIQTV